MDSETYVFNSSYLREREKERERERERERALKSIYGTVFVDLCTSDSEDGWYGKNNTRGVPATYYVSSLKVLSVPSLTFRTTEKLWI